MATVDVDAWANAQPAGSVPTVATARHAALRPAMETLAHARGFNLVFDRVDLVYASPDIDLTPVLLGHTDVHVPLATHAARVDMQRALEDTRRGRATKATLKQEYDRKQAEINQRVALFKASHAQGDPRQAQVLAELRQRYRELSGELEQHEHDATAALLQRLIECTRGVAQRHGVEIVLEAHYGGSRDPLYRHGTRVPLDGLDLTQELIETFDREYP